MQKLERKSSFLIIEILSWLFSIVLSISIAVIFFNNHSLWNDLPIVWDDFPVHIYRSSVLLNVIFPQFQTVFGFIGYFYAGSPEIHMYPIGIYLILAGMGSIGLNLNVGIRILLFSCMILNILTPQIIIKILRLPIAFGPIATLWYTFGAGNTLWINFLSFGMIAYCFSYSFTAFLFARLIKIDFSKSIHVFPLSINLHRNEILNKEDKSRDFINILLLCSIILFNFTTLIYVAFYLIFFLLFHISKRNFKSIIKNIIIYLIKIGIWMIILTSFWLIPSIFIQYQYMGPIQHNVIFSFEHGINTINSLISRGWTSIQAYFLLLALYFIFKFIFDQYIQTNKIFKIMKSQRTIQYPFQDIKQKVNYSILITLSTFIFVIITPYLKIDMLSGINSYRYYVFFECFMPIFMILVVLYFYYFLRELIDRFLTSMDDKQFFGKKISYLIISLLTVTLSLFYSSNLFFYNCTNQAPEINTLNYALTSEGTPFYPFSYVRWDPGFLELIEWIKSNTDGSTRILMENSGEEGGLRLGGHTLGLVALWTEREFIGGYISHFWYDEANKSAFQDGKLFGININEISSDYVLEQCQKYNIEYIITWSDPSKSFFNAWNSTIHSELIEMGNVSWFYIYKIVNPQKSWIFSYSCYPEVNNIIRTDKKTNFVLTNVTENDIIYYSLHDFYNWHIYVNGTSVNKIKNQDNFLAFKVPNAIDTVDYEIQIIWEVSFIEIGSNIISILSTIIFFTSLISSIHGFYFKIVKIINRRISKRFIKLSN